MRFAAGTLRKRRLYDVSYDLCLLKNIVRLRPFARSVVHVHDSHGLYVLNFPYCRLSRLSRVKQKKKKIKRLSMNPSPPHPIYAHL